MLWQKGKIPAPKLNWTLLIDLFKPHKLWLLTQSQPHRFDSFMIYIVVVVVVVVVVVAAAAAATAAAATAAAVVVVVVVAVVVVVVVVILFVLSP